jgi:hypothetical protein
MEYKLSWWLVALFLLLSLACANNKRRPTKQSEPLQIKLVTVTEANRVDVTVNGNLFTSCMYADTFEKPFLFPVVAADGITVTRGFPIVPRQGEGVDHPHHTGFWFNYGNVNGVDFWGNSKSLPPEERKKCGVIRLRNIDKMESLSDRGILAVTNEWVNPDGSVPLEEHTTFSFYAGENYRIIDRITTLTSKVPEITFADTKEGAFAIRVARFLEFPSEEPEIFVDASGKQTEVPVLDNEGVNGNYLSSEGIEGAKVWGTRARWMKLYAVNGSDTISIVFMDHPSNLNYPTFWHARDYGLFSANPFGQKDFTNGKEELNFKLKQGESVTFKHRLYIKSGSDFVASDIDEEWNKFSKL